MKNNYRNIKPFFLICACLFIGHRINAQDIEFTFENAQNTNDGSNDYYEVDIMIKTINGTGTFKLGSGQLYFLYNTDAFGENVSANNRIEATQPEAEGYICGQNIDAAAAPLYGTFTINDNTTSRVSWAFSQVFSASTIANDNVTETATRLFHLKLQYVDVNEDPMVLFEDGTIFDDQFFTACGGNAPANPFDTADCTNQPGSQILNDFFDSSNAALSVPEFEDETNIEFSLYPNPTKDIAEIRTGAVIEKVEVFDILGKLVSESSGNIIDLENYNSGVYLVKVHSNKSTTVKRLVKE